MLDLMGAAAGEILQVIVDVVNLDVAPISRTGSSSAFMHLHSRKGGNKCKSLMYEGFCKSFLNCGNTHR